MPTRSIQEITAELRKKPIERSFVVERDAAIDEESRTVNLAFASDTPVEHWFGTLELSMKGSAMRTDRLKSGAPLLMDHNTRDQVGVVENFKITGGIARADVRFDTDQRSSDVFNSVKNGVRRNVSVGFLVHSMELTNQKEADKGAIPMYRSDDWEPYEISIVAVPADISVGVGRSSDTYRAAARDEGEGETPAEDAEDQCPECEMPIADCTCEAANSRSIQVSEPLTRAISTKTEKPMAKENEETPGTPVETRTADQIARDAKAAVRGEIVELGRVLGLTDVATAYLRDAELADDGTGATVDAFKAYARSKQPATTRIPVQDPTTIAREQGGVQLARTMPRFGTLKNFTGENGAERAMRFGQWFLAARGIEAGKASLGAFARAAQFCTDHGIDLSRAMAEGVNESGGFLVPEEFGNDLIDLREQYGVFRRNAKMVPMSSDTKSNPRRTGGLTAYFEGEGDAITASDKAWDRVSLTAKKLAVLARYSSEVNEDAIINLADDLAGEIAYAFAVKEDNCGFIGDGTSTYGGMQGVCTKIKGLNGTIANIAGLTVATGTGYGTNYASAVLTDFEAVVGNLPVYADTARAKWYMHKSFYWNVAKKLELAAGGATAAEISQAAKRTFLGYEVEYVQVMPKTSAVSQVCALLGDLSLAASFGSRRDTSIAISEHSRFANDQIEIRGTERFDINVHDVGNASATAGNRVAGPIVGLITAAS